MAEIIDYKDKFKRYFWATREEYLGMAVAILCIAFIISFRDWGSGEVFSFSEGMLNLMEAIVIVALSFSVFDAGQRLWGLAINYRLRYKVWSLGLLVGLIVCFLTNGSVWLILPSGFLVEHLTAYRLGWFRYGINMYGQGLMALGGPIACLLLIIVIKLFSFVLPATFVEKAVMFNFVYIITQMIPFPPLAGSKMYFGSKMVYAFTMPAIVSAAILLVLDINILLSAFLAIVIGVCLWLTYYFVFEQYAWKGPG
jgi:hypothetical protein